MLRVAVPNKGALSEPAAAMLRDAGYRQRQDPRDLSAVDSDNDVQFFYLRPKDIATYVAKGQVDLGITGLDLMEESGAAVRERLKLGFGGSRFRYACPAGLEWTIKDLEGKRIATSYPRLVRGHLARNGIAVAEVVRLDGAVEIAVSLGVADAIADVVGSGRTLAQHGLVAFDEPILVSESVLVDWEPGPGIGRKDTPERAADKNRFTERLRGVVYARQYVMLDYDCPVAREDAAVGLTPGLQSPTVMHLRDPDWVAVRSMVKRGTVNSIMDELAALGCRGIVTSDIRTCRGMNSNGG